MEEITGKVDAETSKVDAEISKVDTETGKVDAGKEISSKVDAGKEISGEIDTGIVKGNIVGILAYLGTILAAVLLLILEKDNKFVRFHAAQSLITFLAVFVIETIVSVMASVLWVLFAFIPLIWFVWVVVFIFLMYKAYQGQTYRLPVIGDFAAKQVGI